MKMLLTVRNVCVYIYCTYICVYLYTYIDICEKRKRKEEGRKERVKEIEKRTKGKR